MVKEGDNSSGITSVIIGILGIVISLSLPVQSLILGITGIVFSSVQKKKANNSWAKAGLILNIISIVLAIAAFVLVIYFINNNQLISQLAQGA